MAGSEDEKRDTVKTPPAARPTTPSGTPDPSQLTAELNLTESSLGMLGERFDLLAEIGRGGMGIVYKARDRETNETVALKVLKPEIASRPDLIERFKSELRLARKITHKNVCRTYDLHRFGDTVVIAMEFVEGDSLRAVLERFGGVPLRRGLEWAAQICSALGEAHAQGIVHRDLKPENIVIDRAGQAKVMDFGIARSIESATTATAAGAIVGTPAYMSPEQAEGKPADARSDIYSLGLILYEMFTGRPALRAETPMALALKQIHETPPAPREVEPYLPPFLDRAIRRSLEKNPNKRFQTTLDLAAALSEKAEEQPIAEGAEVLEIPAHLAYWRRSDWALLASAVVGTILFLVLFYRFHPASAMEISVGHEESKQIVAGVLKKLGVEAQVGDPSLEYWPESYYEGALSEGLRPTHELLARRGFGGWHGELRGPGGRGDFVGGGYALGVNGELRYLDIPRAAPSLSPAGTPTPAADQLIRAARERFEKDPSKESMKQAARNFAATLFGEDVSRLEPTVRFFGVLPTFESEGQEKASGLWEWVAVTVEGSRLISVTRYLGWQRLHNPEAGRDVDQVFGHYLNGVAVIVLLALILFFVRGLYRDPAARAAPALPLLVALAIGIGVGIVSQGVRDPVMSSYKLIMGPLEFCLFLLLSVVVNGVALSYLRRRLPPQAAGYLLLAREKFGAKPAGLELLRGILAGGAFVGAWLALVSIAGFGRLAAPGMVVVLQPFPTSELVWESLSLPPGSLSPAFALFPGFFLFECFAVPCLLVALPLGLLARVTRRTAFRLAALAALWLAAGFSLLGASVLPSLAFYVFAALQAVFFGYVLLRYGFLATLGAVFTVETALLVFPLLVIFHKIAALPFALLLGLWMLVLLAALFVYLRAEFTAAYRRVAAVFE